VLSLEVVEGKKKALLELDDTEATRKLVQAFRKGANNRGGTPQAYQVAPMTHCPFRRDREEAS
jgi:hypothetical protein